jgi:hypothetical protein
MSKSQNTKNERNADVSKTLTKQWKKGELPEGFYFVNDGAEVTIDYYLCDYWERHFDSDVQQVLASVPTFKELQNMNEAVNQAMSANIKLVEQNKQLKELLKECRNSLEEQSNVRKLYESDVEYRDRYNNKMDLLIKLDEVLNA